VERGAECHTERGALLGGEAESLGISLADEIGRDADSPDYMLRLVPGAWYKLLRRWAGIPKHGHVELRAVGEPGEGLYVNYCGRTYRVPRAVFATVGRVTGTEAVYLQYPLVAAGAGTAHVLQGGTLERLYLSAHSDAWTHGQLHSVLTRVTTRRGLMTVGSCRFTHWTNIVWDEIITAAYPRHGRHGQSGNPPNGAQVEGRPANAPTPEL